FAALKSCRNGNRIMSLSEDHTPVSQPAQGGGPHSDRLEVGSASAAPAPSTGPVASARIWSMVLAAGLLAGLGGFGIGEAAPRLVPPSLDLPPEIRASGSMIPLENERRMSSARDSAAALTYGGLGALLGLALGAAGGLSRRRPRAAALAGLCGL